MSRFSFLLNSHAIYPLRVDLLKKGFLGYGNPRLNLATIRVLVQEEGVEVACGWTYIRGGEGKGGCRRRKKTCITLCTMYKRNLMKICVPPPSLASMLM